MKQLGLILTVFLMVSLVATSRVQIPAVKAQETSGDFGNPIAPEPLDINWTRFWKLFNAHSAWDLEYNNGSGWISDKSQLQVIKNKTVFWKIKITLNFTASYTADYRLTFGIDLDVKNYTYRESKWKYIISYKNHTVFFDWSDLAEISGLTITHGIKPIGDESWFWFRVRRNNVPQGYNIILDPSFGNDNEEATTWDVGPDQRAGCKFSVSESGTITITNISAYLYISDFNSKFRHAIYVDNAGAPGDLEGVSDEGIRTGGAAFSWRPLDANFDIAGTGTYWICVWGESAIFGPKRAGGSTNQACILADTYDGTYPDPFGTPDNYYDYKASFYANYTVSGAQEYEYDLTATVNPSESLDYDAEKDFMQTETAQPLDSLDATGEKLYLLPASITPAALLFLFKETIVYIAQAITPTEVLSFYKELRISLAETVDVTALMNMQLETVSYLYELLETVTPLATFTWLAEKVFYPSAIINLDSALAFGKETFEQLHEFLETVNPLDALSKTLEGLAGVEISVLSISFGIIALAVAFCALALVIKRREGE